MAKSEGRFQYRGKDRTVESVVRRGQQAGRSYDSYINSEFPMFKVREGECSVRILPPTWKDTETWGDGWDIPVYIHYNVGPDNATYLCLDKMKKERCPVCEARRDATDEEEQSAMRVSERRLAWVVDRDNEKAGPQIWSMPASLFKDICSRSVDKKTQRLLLIDDPEQGNDIIFNREGTDKRTKYTGVEVAREETPIHDNEKIEQRWLDYVTDNPLPELLQYYDAEYIEKVLFGQGSRGEAEGEEAGETARPRRSSRHRGGETEEEEEQPSGRASTRRGARRGEEETEAETPRGRRAARGTAEDEWPSGEERTSRRGRREVEEEEPEDRGRRAERSERGRVSARDEEEETSPRHRRATNGGGEDETETETDTEAEPRPRRAAAPRGRLSGVRERHSRD